MIKTTFIRTMVITGLTILCASHAYGELIFDNTKFEFKSSKKIDSGRFERVNQSYESSGENKHQCSMYVSPRTTSSVAEILNLDKAIMTPPVTIAPLEIVNKPTQKYKEDAASIILLRDFKDNSKFKVVLHRATLIDESIVRELQIECSLKYSGLFGKSISEFENLKAAWLADVFALDPEIVSAQ